MDKVLKTLKGNANKATSILLTAIPQIGSMEWTNTLHTLKVSTQMRLMSSRRSVCVCTHNTGVCYRMFLLKSKCFRVNTSRNQIHSRRANRFLQVLLPRSSFSFRSRSGFSFGKSLKKPDSYIWLMK